MVFNGLLTLTETTDRFNDFQKSSLLFSKHSVAL